MFKLYNASCVALMLVGLLGCTTLPAIREYLKIRKQVGPSVVVLRGEEGGGTGFQVQTSKGIYILTNDHICGLANKEGFLEASLEIDTAPILRKVIERSVNTDLCLVEAFPGVKPLKVAESEPKAGDQVFTYGHPFLQPLTSAEGEFIGITKIEVPDHEIKTEEDRKACNLPKNSIGTIRIFFIEVEYCFNSVPAYETTLVIYPGNSGSPMVNSDGNVTGVIFAASGRNNWGMVIPLQDVKQFLSKY